MHMIHICGSYVPSNPIALLDIYSGASVRKLLEQLGQILSAYGLKTIPVSASRDIGGEGGIDTLFLAS